MSVNMARPRRTSAASEISTIQDQQQELGSMYDYLAKIILLGPSGAGKSCLLHRFVKNEWRVLSSQTIGVEFASKIVKIGTGSSRKRVKLQLWDTAGTERFRSVSRSYYRGAAGAILVYDVASSASFHSLPTFLMDARALASPNLTVILAGNKADLTDEKKLLQQQQQNGRPIPPPSRHQHHLHPPSDSTTPTPSFTTTSSYPHYQDTPDPKQSTSSFQTATSHTSSQTPRSRSNSTTTNSAYYNTALNPTQSNTIVEREVSADVASRWASRSAVPVTMEVSALSGENVDEVFNRLARMILTKIELGVIDPDDPQSGIQYGDLGASGGWDGGSVRSIDDSGTALRRRRNKGGGAGGGGGGAAALLGIEDVFRTSGGRGGRCC